ncbi:MAG: DUF1926 domain-containing protein [Gemmatimonadetes bacterium]|nr:DUF1926 domain-containing protein [Gemmatimonadota bacterium]
MTETRREPLYFAFGLHAHQPVGNFDHVFEDHIRDVYEPFLRKITEGGLLPVTLHLSGPLLDWLEANRSGYLDLVGELAAAGQVELLLAGYYEPILPSLPPADRVEQIVWMREAIRHRFGQEAKGLWLTERVWEPELAADLVEAGVEYVLVDDRHFLAAGFRQEELAHPFRTESSGRALGVFPIDEKLRYLLPFHPPEDTVAYLREMRDAGGRIAVAADDIEKFGGWPGTKKLVYRRRWLDRFMRALVGLVEEDEIRMVTYGTALRELPSAGIAYLPSASYREMEEWALPPQAFQRLERLKSDLGWERATGEDASLIRGSHWRNFMVKYPEANRMHKKALALSALCRERGDPEGVRRGIGRAQCNDAYWHGVFGGLYLRHLRDAVWANLAAAEGELRPGEPLQHEMRDVDLDGHVEVSIHSSLFSAVVSPARGGQVEELTFFGPAVNAANTLTRRREAYHLAGVRNEAGDVPSGTHDGPAGDNAPGDEEPTPSIHEIEDALNFAEPPPVDPHDRAILVESLLPSELTEDAYRRGEIEALVSWAGRPLTLESVDHQTAPDGGAAIIVVLSDAASGLLEKSLTFLEDGSLEVHYRWDADDVPGGGRFTTEISLGADMTVTPDPTGEVWSFPIATFSKSERGFDETIQGTNVTLLWPAEIGEARVRIEWPSPPASGD